jgi:hypothetical protein
VLKRRNRPGGGRLGGAGRRRRRRGWGGRRSNAGGGGTYRRRTVGVGGARAAAAQGGGVNDVSRCAAAMVDRAHAKKFSRTVRRREGVKARRYANLTFVGGSTYIHRLTGEYSGLYSSVSSTFLGFGTEKSSSVIFLRTEKYKKIKKGTLFSCSDSLSTPQIQ